MHLLRGWKWVVCGGLVGSVQAAAVLKPIITPAPEPSVEEWVKRQIPDAASFAQVLLTAIPLSLREIAVTNAPAVSSILWEQFLDDKKPQWFLDLPVDIQSYLIVEYGPETAWPTAPATTPAKATPTESMQPTRSSAQASNTISSSASQSVSSVVTFSTSTRSSSSSSKSGASTASTSSAASPRSATASSTTSDPVSSPASIAGLTRREKMGLGFGIPLGLFGAAALLLACCFLLRRKRNKNHINGKERPSSPGFIPRFAFQDKPVNHYGHRAPLNSSFNQSNHDLGYSNWEDDGIDPYDHHPYEPATLDVLNRASTFPPTASAGVAPISMHDPTPVMAPALFHTHSSNRARGRRTSYTSLHSVAEVTEPYEHPESPIIGRHTTPLQRKRRPSMPMVLEMPPSLIASVPRAATIKRKPIPDSPTDISSPAADAASQSLLRPALIQPVDHSGSSSSGLALSSNSSTAGPYAECTSPISPLSEHPHAPRNPFRDSQTYIAYSPGAEKTLPKNPFSNDYSYVEDYGPEYSSGYVDHEDGAYGGHRSLDQYPTPSPLRRSSKTEWPLKNMVSLKGRRNVSPMWDRVYESP